MKQLYKVKRKEIVFFQKEKEVETVICTREELISMLEEGYIVFEAVLIQDPAENVK